MIRNEESNTKRFNTNDSGIISRAVMIEIEEQREAQISHVHTLNIAMGKCTQKNQPKQPFFWGGRSLSSGFSSKVSQVQLFFG